MAESEKLDLRSLNLVEKKLAQLRSNLSELLPEALSEGGYTGKPSEDDGPPDPNLRR